MRVLARLAVAITIATAGCGNDTCDPTSESCTLEAELWVQSITQHNDGAYHHANWFFVPQVTAKMAPGQQVGVTPTGEVRYQGPCSLTAFPWNHEKPGGPPPLAAVTRTLLTQRRRVQCA